MRRFFPMLFILSLLFGCRLVSSSPVTPSPALVATVTQSPLPPSPLPPPTASPTPVPSPTLPPPSPTVAETTQSYQVFFHPDGGMYAGDRVSFEVLPREVVAEGSEVEIETPQGDVLGPKRFEAFGIAQRIQATFDWSWDTHGLGAGDYTLTFTVQPEGYSWTEIATLLPESQIPPPEPGAQWASARSDCCVLHYITGTAAERDLDSLLAEADLEAEDAIQRMGITFADPITITLLPRVIGHGGFAGAEIAISYLDRNYASPDFGMVLHHEMIHILDGRLGSSYSPTIFVEGLAVALTGGHFKPEPLLPRAAVLLEPYDGRVWYLPLQELADNFYPSQHEIGYLEAAALTEFMTQEWGQEAFSEFYRHIQRPDVGENPSQAIDRALRKYFDISFAELEKRFIDTLRQQEITDELRNDMHLSVYYFDALRRYQQLLIPSAYFRTAWPLDTDTMRRKGIVADYLRSPATPTHLALETLLVAADEALFNGQFDRAREIITAVNAVLDALEAGDPQPFAGSPLAQDFLGIVTALQAADYRPQRIELSEEMARAWVTQPSGPQLIPLSLERGEEQWVIVKDRGSLEGFYRLPEMFLGKMDWGEWALFRR